MNKTSLNCLCLGLKVSYIYPVYICCFYNLGMKNKYRIHRTVYLNLKIKCHIGTTKRSVTDLFFQENNPYERIKPPSYNQMMTISVSEKCFTVPVVKTTTKTT